jgi:multiple sugar transport system permease protein
MNKILKRRPAGELFVLPGMAGVLLFFFLPLLISAGYAFYDTAAGFGIGNFAHIFRSAAFGLAFWNTWKLLFAGLVLLFAAAITLALLLSYLGKYNPRVVFWLLVVQLIPMAVPSSVTGLFVTDVFGASGIINGLIVANGGESVEFLSSGLAFPVMLLLYLWKNAGLAVLLFYTRINAIPKSILEAARLDGANTHRLVRHIILPQLNSAFFFVFVIGIWGIFKLTRESYIIFGNYPASSIYGFQNFLTNHFSNANYSILSAASLVFFVVVSVMLLLPIATGFEER